MAHTIEVCIRSDSAFTFLIWMTSSFKYTCFMTLFREDCHLFLLFCFMCPEDSRKRYAHPMHLQSASRDWWGVHSAHRVDLSAPLSSLRYRSWCASAGALQASSTWRSRIWSWSWWWSRCHLRLMITLLLNLFKRSVQEYDDINSLNNAQEDFNSHFNV